MRKYLMMVCLVVIACQQKPAAPARTVMPARPADLSKTKVSEVITPAPRFMDHSLLGSDLGPDGMVAKENSLFTVGQPIYLTLVVRESPPGLQTSAVWMSPDRQPIRTERKEMNGAKVATFGLRDPKLKPGHYRVIGYWGGNVAAQREFDVVARGKVQRKSG